MLTLEEKLRSTHRYATLQDFRLGLEYEEIQPQNGGRKHNFVRRVVREPNFVYQTREFVLLLNQRLVLVPFEDAPSDEYVKAQAQIMSSDEVKELLESYPDSEKIVEKKEEEKAVKPKKSKVK